MKSKIKSLLAEIKRLDEILQIDMEPTEPVLVVQVHGPFETSYGTIRAHVQIDTRPGLHPVRGDPPWAGETALLHMPIDDYWYVTRREVFVRADCEHS